MHRLVPSPASASDVDVDVDVDLDVDVNVDLDGMALTQCERTNAADHADPSR